jgi:phosphatidylglycerol---prolipoprotein diacylglyceryl transferase
MEFPVSFALGPLTLSAHFVCEALAYAVGVRLYLRQKSRVSEPTRLSVLVGAALGAALGSKLLYWLEWPADTLQHLGDVRWLLGGKSLVGGLLGGFLGVELAKARASETRSTGDGFVLPLAVAIAIGRVGCFASGLDDHTAGVATSLPWGVDFGDGVPRHPTQLYELAWVLVTGGLLQVAQPARPGVRFRLFFALYLAFRLLCDALRPDPRWLLGLSAIQLACVMGLVYLALEPRSRLV